MSDPWANVRTNPAACRYPFAPLDAYAGELGVRALARRLRTSRDVLDGLRRRGLTEEQADRYACRLGVHPGEIWPGWFDDGLTAVDRVFDGLRAREGVA